MAICMIMNPKRRPPSSAKNRRIAYDIGAEMLQPVVKRRLDSLLTRILPGHKWSAVTSELWQNGYAEKVGGSI